MVAGQHGEQRQPKYRCKAAKEIGPVACTGGYVMATFVEQLVYDWLRERAEHVDKVAGEVGGAAALQSTLQAQETVLARQIARAHDALTRFEVNNAKDPMPEQVYRDARRELLDEAGQLEQSLELVQRDLRRAPDDVSAVAAGLLEQWHKTSVAVRREVLRRLVDCVLVRTGRPRAWMTVVESWEVRPGTAGL